MSSSFSQAVQMVNSNSVIETAVTANGMPTHASTGNRVLELFFILGAARGKDISNQFTAAFMEDPILTLKALFWARDVRGGAGERDTFRKLMLVAERLMPERVLAVLPLIPEYGRWDDGFVFESAAIRQAWFRIVGDAIGKGEHAKELLSQLDSLTEEECEQLLSSLRR